MRTHCCRHKCFPVCPRAQHLLRTQILCPQQMFPSLRSPRNIMGNNVSATMCPQQCVLVYQGLYVSQGSTNTAPQATPGKIWLKFENQSQDIREVVLPVTLVENNSYCKPFDYAIILSECTDFFCYLETNSLSFCFLFTHSE